MRWLIDNQLPPALARLLNQCGHEAVHVTDVGLHAASDQTLWVWAARQSRVVISKDEDLVAIAHRDVLSGRLVWVRLGNCRSGTLLYAFERSLPAILDALNADQRVVVLA